MSKITLFFLKTLLSFFLVSLTLQTGQAQESGLWHVGPISGKAKSSDLVEAKQSVINTTRATAFSILLKRIVIEKHQSKLANLDDTTIARLEVSRQIIDEKFGGSLYSANLSFDFLPSAVEEFLISKQVAFSLAKPDTILIIADGVNLPQGEGVNPTSNLWQDIFEYQNPKIFIGNPIVLSAKVEPEMLHLLRNNDLNTFNKLKQLYGVDAVMFSWFNPASNPQKLQLTHNKNDSLQKINFAIPKNPPIVNSVTNTNVNNSADKKAMVTIRAQIEAFWRQEWFVNPAKNETEYLSMDMIVSYPNLRQFITIQSLLSNIKNLEAFVIHEVSLSSALATLTYNGRNEKLQQDLLKRGLRIRQDERTGFWQLQTQ